PRLERVTGGPNSEGERRRKRAVPQFSLPASGQGEAAFEPLLVVRATTLQEKDMAYPARNLVRYSHTSINHHRNPAACRSLKK
ncbi:hypothetical protein, partial [Dickeya dianthicola]